MAAKKEKEKKWIQGAVKREGRVRRLAAKEGGIGRNGKIKLSWLEKKIAEVKKRPPSKEKRSLLSALYLARRFAKGI